MVTDSKQRSLATDPEHSYIVQAPAGSGKTELLTQRFLRLLARVAAPEHIIALTFTRKAASEMRDRILSALRKSAAGVEATSGHQQQTLEYAREALVCDKLHNWQLLENPGRLRIMTIDALCQHLANAIPLTEQSIPFAEICETPEILYQRAARNCLQEACTNAVLMPFIEQLLDYLDNRQEVLIQLFCTLLANREQWLNPIFTAQGQAREHCEEALRLIEEHELKRLQQSLEPSLWHKLQELLHRLLEVDKDSSSPRQLLKNWQLGQAIDRTTVSLIAQVLLTKADKLRNGFDHHVGLAATACSKAEYQQLKKESQELFATLQRNETFARLLVKTKNLPLPHYEDSQWQMVQALLQLLPRLAAHLTVVFYERGSVDFSAMAQAALEALGSEDAPSDLALHLDYTIHHLLIDEFQDTSIIQFQLLQKLVQGWQPQDTRTLFIVGDPMQSIYRFRQAEVGLFLRARQEGIGNIRLIPLELSSNFRATENIVTWLNQQFSLIFPQKNDIESGAICFHNAQSMNAASSDSLINAYCYPNKQLEGQGLIQIIQHELAAHPEASIAVLVRSRSQLRMIIPLLREHNIDFQGVDIEPLAKQFHIMDAWTLTKALLMPADRLAWLALLRSPYCGLMLTDLHQIGQWHATNPILMNLQDPSLWQHLSEEGQIRLRYLLPILTAALNNRHKTNLMTWIRGVLSQLHFEKLLSQEQQNDIQQFLLLIDGYDNQGQLIDCHYFEEKLANLYSRKNHPARLQIMTIHKSKGLEFDTVILPGLGNRTKQNDAPLLRWLKLPRFAGEEIMLISPIRARYARECLLYDYIAALDDEKGEYEQQRLLYVAATRAKKRLYLLDNREKASAGSLRSLFHSLEFEYKDTETLADMQPVKGLLIRLPISVYQQDVFKGHNTPPQIVAMNPASSAHHLGTAAHLLLQWLCTHHVINPNRIPWFLADNFLKNCGFSAAQMQQARTILEQWLTNFLNHPQARFIIGPHHNEANEVAWLTAENGQVSTRIIDRTFEVGGSRWIIDFKTGKDDDCAQKEHQSQVNAYAKLMHATNPDIQCGLFYLSTNRWLNWQYLHTMTAHDGQMALS